MQLLFESWRKFLVEQLSNNLVSRTTLEAKSKHVPSVGPKKALLVGGDERQWKLLQDLLDENGSEVTIVAQIEQYKKTFALPTDIDYIFVWTQFISHAVERMILNYQTQNTRMIRLPTGKGHILNTLKNYGIIR